MNRGLGCVRPVVAPHLVRPSFRMHAAGIKSPPQAYDQRASGLVAAVKDQGQVGSCEAHSSSGATETYFALAGQPLGFVPSEDHLYRGARCVDRAQATPVGVTLPALTDSGTTTESILAFMQAFGIKPRWEARTIDGRNSDCEVAGVNDEVRLGDLEASDGCLVVGPYAIDPTASDGEQLAQAAIAAKIPVRIDTFVDSAFEQWSPGRPPVGAPDENDPSGGGHALYVVGYYYDAISGQFIYFVRNSWGTGAGEGGDWRCSGDWLRAVWSCYPWLCKKVRG